MSASFRGAGRRSSFVAPARLCFVASSKSELILSMSSTFRTVLRIVGIRYSSAATYATSPQIHVGDSVATLCVSRYKSTMSPELPMKMESTRRSLVSK